MEGLVPPALCIAIQFTTTTLPWTSQEGSYLQSLGTLRNNTFSGGESHRNWKTRWYPKSSMLRSSSQIVQKDQPVGSSEHQCFQLIMLALQREEMRRGTPSHCPTTPTTNTISLRPNRTRGQQSGWSPLQYNVINHFRARPYTQPGRGNTFPFLMFELKSEAAGGTLYAAENQAAGSGSHSVNALLWLLQEAQKSGLSNADLMMDTVSFSFVMSHREAVFYIHWQSAENKRFYMSRLKSYSAFEPDEIRACNNAIKNTVENALGARKTKIGNALLALFPIPEHWNPVRTKPPTPAASIPDNPRPAKKGRR